MIGYIWEKRVEGVYAHRSLLMTLKKVNRNFNFQSNESTLMFIRPTLAKKLICPWGITYNTSPGLRGALLNPEFFLSFKLFWTECLSKNFDQIHLQKRGLRGVDKLHSDHFWLLKRASKIRFTIKWALLQSLCYHPFHKNLTYPRGIIYNTCLQVLVGCFIPGVFVILSLVYFEH